MGVAGEEKAVKPNLFVIHDSWSTAGEWPNVNRGQQALIASDLYSQAWILSE
jgi:hypothetical protein